MKKVIFLLILSTQFFSSITLAKKCYEILGDKKSAGGVSYEVLDQTCTENTNKDKTCLSVIRTADNACKNKKTLIQYSCDKNGLPQQTEVPCQCKDGLCKKL